MRSKRAIITLLAVLCSGVFSVICLLLPGRIFKEGEQTLLDGGVIHREVSSFVPDAIRRNPLALSLYSGAMLYDYDRNQYFFGEKERKQEDVAVIYDAVVNLTAAGILTEDTAGSIREQLSLYGGNCTVNVTRTGQELYSWPLAGEGRGVSVSIQRDPYVGAITSLAWSGLEQDVSLTDTVDAYLAYLGFEDKSLFFEVTREMATGKEIIYYAEELQLCVTVWVLTFNGTVDFTLQVQSMSLNEYQRAVE